MQRAANMLRGSVRIEIEGRFPERFLNLCAAKNVSFWDLQRVSESLYRASVSVKGYLAIRPHADASFCSVKCIGKNGLPFLAWRIRKRYVLIAGFLLVWAALWLSSLFIWDFEVHGNENVSEGEIIAALEDIGIKIGTFGPSINQEDVRSRVLLEIDELSWITVNVSGSRAEVIVRERVPKPVMIDKKTATDVIAQKSGIITKINVYEGKTQLKIGDTVAEGDLLVSGTIESLSNGTRYVHAMADIYARTWYEISRQIPVQYAEKSYTGEKESKKAIVFCGKRLNLYFTSGISGASCDKINMRKNLSLPGDLLSFIGIETETCYEYDLIERQLSQSEAEEILAPRLYDELLSQIDGEVVQSEIYSKVENGMIIVTMRAECQEQIAAVREIER